VKQTRRSKEERWERKMVRWLFPSPVGGSLPALSADNIEHYKILKRGKWEKRGVTVLQLDPSRDSGEGGISLHAYPPPLKSGSNQRAKDSIRQNN